MFARLRIQLTRYFFFGNTITHDGYKRLVYLLARFLGFAPFSLCATVVLGVYSLFRPVKILILRCERSKISYIVEDLEVALRLEANRTRISGRRPALIFALLDTSTPNRALTDMYARAVPFFDDNRLVLRGILRYVIPVLRVKREYLRKRQEENQKEIWARQESVLSFSIREQQDGVLLQENLLTNTHKPFICIGIAEQSYYKTKYSTEQPLPTGDDLFSCFPSWENYLPCILELLDRGYGVLRMGEYVDGPLPENADPRMVDYAGKSRTEFGDIWLLANCRFVVAGGTGLYWTSSAFNRSTVLTDSFNLIHTTNGPNDLILPQLARSRSEKCFRPFSWILANGEWAQNRSLIEGDIEIVKNTSEEITEVVLEMEQRLNGTWVETDEDIELQNRFRKLRDVVPQWRIQQTVQIGADFLRRYQYLL